MKASLFLAAGILLLTACNSGDEHAGHRMDGFSDVAKTPEDSLFKLVMEGARPFLMPLPVKHLPMPVQKGSTLKR